MSMDEKIVFSLEEIQEIATISQSLKEELKDSMLPDDELALREVIKSTIESGKLHRDIFPAVRICKRKTGRLIVL